MNRVSYDAIFSEISAFTKAVHRIFKVDNHVT